MSRRESLWSFVVPWMAALMFASVAGTAYAEDYRIATGDSIAVTVFGESDLSLGKTYVPASGTISFPLIGEVKVAGYTARELERFLTNRYRDGYLRKPEITVSVVEVRPFYINGAVNSPGGYPYKQAMTVRLAITFAGGFSDDAAAEKITIIREGSQEPIDAADDTAVYPGDIINVGRTVASGKLFYVHGEVKSPGAYPYRDGLTVEKAVTLAGGLTRRASERKISIARGEGEQQSEVKAKLSTAVEPGDVISVGQSIF